MFRDSRARPGGGSGSEQSRRRGNGPPMRGRGTHLKAPQSLEPVLTVVSGKARTGVGESPTTERCDATVQSVRRNARGERSGAAQDRGEGTRRGGDGETRRSAPRFGARPEPFFPLPLSQNSRPRSLPLCAIRSRTTGAPLRVRRDGVPIRTGLGLTLGRTGLGVGVGRGRGRILRRLVDFTLLCVAYAHDGLRFETDLPRGAAQGSNRHTTPRCPPSLPGAGG